MFAFRTLFRKFELRQRLESEKKLEQWVYLVPDWNLDQLLISY